MAAPAAAAAAATASGAARSLSAVVRELVRAQAVPFPQLFASAKASLPGLTKNKFRKVVLPQMRMRGEIRNAPVKVDGKTVVGVALNSSPKVRRMMETNLELASRTVVAAQKAAAAAAAAAPKKVVAAAAAAAKPAKPAAGAPKAALR